MSDATLGGSRIRARRLDQGLTQAALAQTLGISPSYLNLIEHNKRRIGGKLLAAAARALGTEANALSDGAGSRVIDGLRNAAGGADGIRAEIALAEDLAGRFPGWADLIVAQNRRIAGLDRALGDLNDRLTQDPFLSASVHDMLSSVTALRATSAILTDEPDLSPEWRARFHRNLTEDSRRLAEIGRGLVGHLDAQSGAERSVATPQDELEAYLAAHGHHLSELEEGHRTPAELVADAPELATQSGRLLAEHWLTRYRDDAAQLPLAVLRGAIADLGCDPAALSASTGAGFALVLRRLACLPEGVEDAPVGLVIADGSGTLTYRKLLADFAVPRFGAACPVWPLYQVLMRPTGPLRRVVAQPGRNPHRFLTYAVAESRQPLGFDGPVVTEATMLILPLIAPPATGTGELAVGTSCRICPRAQCPARREPAIVEERD